MTLYLLTGDNWLRERAVAGLLREIIGQDRDALSVTQLDGEDFQVSRFVEALQSPSLFASGVLVHVRRVDQIEDPMTLMPYLEKVGPTGTHVILEGEKLDKRGKFYKAISRVAEVKDFTRPNRRDLPTVATLIFKDAGIRLSGPGFRYLLENVEGDLSRIGREADKIALYAGDRELTLDELKGLLFRDREGDLFAALDALMERRPSAIRELEEVLAGGEEASKVFYMLASQVRAMLKVRALASERLTNDEIAGKTGDFPWRVAKRRKVALSLPADSLRELLHRLHLEDLRIKRGERQPEESLWTLVFDWIYPPKTITAA